MYETLPNDCHYKNIIHERHNPCLGKFGYKGQAAWYEETCSCQMCTSLVQRSNISLDYKRVAIQEVIDSEAAGVLLVTDAVAREAAGVLFVTDFVVRAVLQKLGVQRGQQTLLVVGDHPTCQTLRTLGTNELNLHVCCARLLVHEIRRRRFRVKRDSIMVLPLLDGAPKVTIA